MSYTDLRDFHAELTAFGPDGTTIEIEKCGGGTLGRSYTGAWRYHVILSDGSVVKGQDLETRCPTTHTEAGRIVCDFLDLDPDEFVGLLLPPEGPDYLDYV